MARSLGRMMNKWHFVIRHKIRGWWEQTFQQSVPCDHFIVKRKTRTTSYTTTVLNEEDQPMFCILKTFKSVSGTFFPSSLKLKLYLYSLIMPVTQQWQDDHNNSTRPPSTYSFQTLDHKGCINFHPYEKKQKFLELFGAVLCMLLRLILSFAC